MASSWEQSAPPSGGPAHLICKDLPLSCGMCNRRQSSRAAPQNKQDEFDGDDLRQIRPMASSEQRHRAN